MSATLGRSEPPTNLNDQFEALLAFDDAKNTFIKELLSRIQALEEKKTELARDLKKAETLNNFYLDRENQMNAQLEDKQKQCEELKEKTSNAPFVLVLIDGDITLFNDTFVRRGQQGGTDAARRLRDDLLGHMKSSSEFKDHWKIIFRVYAKVKYLGRAYVDAGIISDGQGWAAFVEGFNMFSPWHEFINAGNYKEAADNSIKAQFDLFHDNLHCKHIVLAGSGDNSYTGFLNPYVTVNGSIPRVSLLKAIPFPPDFRELASGISVVEFDNLFRTTKLQKLNTKSESNTSEASNNGKPRDDWASKASQAPTTPLTAPRHVTPSVSSDQTRLHTTRRMFFNCKGQRVDEKISPDPAWVLRLKSEKLCNRYFLTQCSYEPCKHKHKYSRKLDDNALRTLRYVSRLSPCEYKNCDDIDCTAGHQCPHGSPCSYGDECYFKGKHGMDTKVDHTKTISLEG